MGRWIGPDGKAVVAALDPGAYSGGKVSEDLSPQRGLAQAHRQHRRAVRRRSWITITTAPATVGGAPKPRIPCAGWNAAWRARGRCASCPRDGASVIFDDLTTGAGRPAAVEYQGELLLTEHSAGSVTSQAAMKRWNRKNELLADAAERASVMAMHLGGAPYPSRETLRRRGTCSSAPRCTTCCRAPVEPKAYEYCWNDELLAANQFAAVEADAVGTVASVLDTQAQKACRWWFTIRFRTSATTWWKRR